MGNNITHLLAINSLGQSFTATEMKTSRTNIGIGSGLFSASDGALTFSDNGNQISTALATYTLAATAPLSLSVASGKLTVTHNNKYTAVIPESGYKVGCDGNGHAIVAALTFSDLSDSIDAANHAHGSLTYDGLLNAAAVSPATSGGIDTSFTTALFALSDGSRYLRPSQNIAYQTGALESNYTNWAKYHFISKKKGTRGTVLFPNYQSSVTPLAITSDTIPTISLKTTTNMGFNKSGQLTSTYQHKKYTAYPLGLYKFKTEDGHISSATEATKDDFTNKTFGLVDEDTTYSFKTSEKTNGAIDITSYTNGEEGTTITVTAKGLGTAAYKDAGVAKDTIPYMLNSVSANLAVKYIPTYPGGLTSFTESKNWNDKHSAAFYSLAAPFYIDENGLISVKVAQPLSWDNHLDLTLNTESAAIVRHHNNEKAQSHGSYNAPALIYASTTGTFCSAYITHVGNIDPLAQLLDCGYATASGSIEYANVTSSNFLLTTEIRPSTSEKSVKFTPKYTGVYRIDVHIPVVYTPKTETSAGHYSASYVHLCMRTTGGILSGGRPAEPTKNSWGNYANATSAELTADRKFDCMHSIHETFYKKCTANTDVNVYFKWMYHTGKNTPTSQMSMDGVLQPNALNSYWFFDTVVKNFNYMYGYVTYAFIGPEH